MAKSIVVTPICPGLARHVWSEAPEKPRVTSCTTIRQAVTSHNPRLCGVDLDPLRATSFVNNKLLADLVALSAGTDEWLEKTGQ